MALMIAGMSSACCARSSSLKTWQAGLTSCLRLGAWAVCLGVLVLGLGIPADRASRCVDSVHLEPCSTLSAFGGIQHHGFRAALKPKMSCRTGSIEEDEAGSLPKPS